MEFPMKPSNVGDSIHRAAFSKGVFNSQAAEIEYGERQRGGQGENPKSRTRRMLTKGAADLN
jgi:hypothetical protein